VRVLSFTGDASLAPSRLSSALSPSMAPSGDGGRHSRRSGMAGSSRGGMSRSPSPTGLRVPTPLSSFEVSSPAPTEEQTDPFECCSATPCFRCVFYQSRRSAKTGAPRSSRPASPGSGGLALSTDTRSGDSTARHGGGGSEGGSEKAAVDSPSDESGPVSPVSFHLPSPVGFGLKLNVLDL